MGDDLSAGSAGRIKVIIELLQTNGKGSGGADIFLD